VALAGERVRAGDTAELAHRRRRGNPATGDIAEHDPDPPLGERERVVPIATDLGPGAGGLVVGGELDARHVGQPLRQEPALELDRDPVILVVELRLADRERGAVGGVVEQRPLGFVERSTAWRRDRDRPELEPLEADRRLL
jgi:hypothetical protein